MSEMDNQPNGIAVIGLAGRFPKAKNIAAFWQNLRNGVGGISFFSDEELRQAGVRVPEGNANFVKARGVLEDADKFDADFFGINPKEAEITDPQHRLFLECAWEALEDAGYAGKRDDRLVGVYAGMSMNTYLLSNLWSRPDVMELVGTYPIMLGNDKDYLPTRVSYKLNLRGPSVNVQTACSTSLVAVCVACEQLINYQCDMALAGGVSVTFPQKRGYVYQEGGIQSPDGHCRAFDAKAEGTVSGDGVGIVLLKRVADALQDGDHIYAVIKGFATNNDGSLKAGFTAPSPDGQAEVIALAQAVAGIDPQSIGYVVAHGTGTPLGDPIEVEGLTKAFRAGTDARQFCALTSVKTNIGHLDAAAGVAGLINAILAVHHREIPPSLHYKSPNPKIDFASSPFFVNTHLREWSSNGEGPRRAAVSSFGIGGTNAHVIIEQAPAAEAPIAGRAANVLVLSARTDSALEKSTEKLAAHLEAATQLSIADVAYTLAVGRGTFEQRRAIVCREAADALTAMRALDPNRVITNVAKGKPSVTFMFPGQGAQHVNMGLELYRTEKVFREQIDGCADTLRSHLDVDLGELLYPRSGKSEESAQRLVQTAFAQPALFAIEYALAKLWMSWGVEPQSLIGHSIGEYVAACLAGVFPLKDALALVALRGGLMQRQPKGSMLAVRLSEAEVKQWLTPEVSLAAINSPGNSVISGPSEVIEELTKKIHETGVVTQKLHTSHAFHSSMMDPIRSAFAQAVQRVHLRAPRIPLISNLTGTWITGEQATSPVYWADHLRQTVRFADGLAELLKQSPLFLLECGPGRTLSTFAKQHPARQPSQAIATSLPQAKAETDDSWAIMQAVGQLWTCGVELDWPVFYGDSRRRVSLPTYPFDSRRHWVEPGQPAELRTTGTATVSTCAPQPAPAEAPAASATATVSGPLGRDLIAASLKSLFSQLSGLAVTSIDSRTSFTELGFDSLFLTQASQAIEKQFNVKVPFGQLLEKYSTLDSLTNHLCESAPVQGASTKASASGESLRQPPQTPAHLEKQGLSDNRAPLTEAQKEIWFAAQHGDDASCVFNESNMLYLKGQLESDLLRSSIHFVVQRHESLRTTFSPDGEFQEVQPTLALELPLLDLSAQSPAEREGQLESLLKQDAREPFDLTKGPLLRCRLIRLQPQLHVLLLTVHHLVCDGASLGIILNEMSEVYSAGRRGVPCELPPALRFVDYARKQASLQNSAEKRETEQYWLDQFNVLPPPLELPLDFPRPGELTFTGGWEYRPLKTSLCRDLSRLSAQQKSTLFVTFLAAYYVFLHRLTGQEEIVVGVPTAERSGEGNEKLVGHCVNFLPLRSRISSSTRFVDYLADLRAAFMTAFTHQNYTFGTLVQKLQLPRERSRTPLISATFNMVWVRTGLNIPGLETELKPNPVSFSNFDLTFNITETDGSFALDCSFKSDLLTGPTVNRWMAYFETLLEGIAANPEQSISKLSLLAEADRAELVDRWNNTGADYPRNALIHELVEAQARRTPDAIAIVAGSEKVTYRQLLVRADQLAGVLRQAGVTAGSVVAVCMGVCTNMLAAVFAVLRAGGALLTLEGSAEEPWNRSIISRAGVVIGPRQMANYVSGLRCKFVGVDDQQEFSANARPSTASNPSAEHLALIVPSGSASDIQLTGFSHRAVVNVIAWLTKNLTAGEGAATLQLKRPGTERFAHEVLATWCSGGTLVIEPGQSDYSKRDIAELIGRHQPDRVFLTQTQLSALNQSWTEGKAPTASLFEVIIHAGDPPLSSDLKQLREKLPKCALLVLYGGGQIGVATAFRLNGSVPRLRAPIGRPINNVQVFILDADLNLAPAGVAGRLFVAGDSVGREFERAGRTRSIRNPIANSKVEQLVETGDLARYLPDGNIELVRHGEARAEIGEWSVDLNALRQAIAQHRGIKEAAVTLREQKPGEKMLVAYAVRKANVNVAEGEILELLRAQLPALETPAAVVFVDSLPRTERGDIAYANLPPFGNGEVSSTELVLPRSATEKLLAQIWAEVIGVDQVGVHDNFFDLGGHSVLVTQVAARIRNVFDIEIGLRPIFERPTVAELAETVESLLVEEISSMSEEEAHWLASQPGLVSRNSK